MLILNDAQRSEVVKFLLMYGMEWSQLGRLEVISQFPYTIWAGPAIRNLLYHTNWTHNESDKPYAQFKLKPETLEALNDGS
jgi:hypothetical protein